MDTCPKAPRLIEIDDLPLFSGTAPRGEAEEFKPADVVTPAYLPGFEPKPIAFGKGLHGQD